jgi:hypothetical protein
MEKWTENRITISLRQGRKSDTDRIICITAEPKSWVNLSVMGVALGLKAANEDNEYSKEWQKGGAMPIDYVHDFAERVRGLKRHPDEIEEWQLDIIKADLDIHYGIVKGKAVYNETGQVKKTSYEKQLTMTEQWSKK